MSSGPSFVPEARSKSHPFARNHIPPGIFKADAVTLEGWSQTFPCRIREQQLVSRPQCRF
jgi:hypothetical protein